MKKFYNTKNNGRIRIISILVAFAFAFALIPATAMASEYGYGYNNGVSSVRMTPYGYVWQEDSGGAIVSQLYKYDSYSVSYYIADSCILRGNTLYDNSGAVIMTDVAGCSDCTRPTAAFDTNGVLTFVSTNGEIRQMTSSTASTYAVASTNLSGTYIVLDNNELARSVKCKSGEKTISSLSFRGSYNRGMGGSTNWNGNGSWNGNGNNNNGNWNGNGNWNNNGSCWGGNDPGDFWQGTWNGQTTGNGTNGGNYIGQYLFNGDTEKTVYVAYQNNSAILEVQCKNSNVWLQTYQTLLSNTCMGAKFVGFSNQYGILMYDMDGTLYYFRYGDYQTAYPISFNSEVVMYFTRDQNGFVLSVTTNRTTYNLSNLLNNAGYGNGNGNWNGNSGSYYVSEVYNTNSESVSYRNGTWIGTLTKSNNRLYWNNANSALSNSSNPTFFGITGTNSPVWISNGTLYHYNGSTVERHVSNVTRLSYDNNGIAVSYYIGNQCYNITF